MYSKEALTKFVNHANNLIKHYMSMDKNSLKVHISKGNRKIGHTMNVSILPLFTCANCKGCKEYCYDIKACLQYEKNVLTARAENTVLAKTARTEYFQQIENAIEKRKKNFFFRWHVAGDIIDIDYLDNMVRIATKYPHFTFWTYTKNYCVVNQYVEAHGNNRKKAIPANLSIMFSEWKGMPMDNKYDFPVFTCVFPDEQFPKGYHKCSGNCNDCIVNHAGCVAGKSSFTALH